MNRKKIPCIFLTLFFLVLNNCLCYANQNSSLKVDSLSAILMDAETGRVLWGKNEYRPMANASTTKIMTAIIALESNDLNDIVTVSKNAASQPEVNMDLKPGERIRLKTLLYALMLQSSNDAAVAIAEHISGNVENFCMAMTSKAKELGAKDTVFETPNGLDTNNHHSTAYDMAVITRYALLNPDFKKIISTKEFTSLIEEENFQSHYISNKNRLLQEYNGAIGVKTGFTAKAGHCFVGAAQREGTTIISVVLASGWGSKGKQQKWVDTKAILDYGFKNYCKTSVIKAGKVYKNVEVKNSPDYKVIEVCFAEDYDILLSKEEKGKLFVKVNIPEYVEAPVLKDEVIGTAYVYIDDDEVGKINLISGQSARKNKLSDWLDKLTRVALNI